MKCKPNNENQHFFDKKFSFTQKRLHAQLKVEMWYVHEMVMLKVIVLLQMEQYLFSILSFEFASKKTAISYFIAIFWMPISFMNAQDATISQINVRNYHKTIE